MVKMVKKIKILETKLEQFVGEGYTTEDLKIVTKETELDTLIKTKKYSNISEQNVKITDPDTGLDEEKPLPPPNLFLLLSGDGIGSEVMHQVKRIIDWMNKARHASFDITESLVGGSCYDKHGCPITDQTLAQALDANAVLLGPIGGSKWDKVNQQKRPEQALPKLQNTLNLCANLRPASVYPLMAEVPSPERNLLTGIDVLFVSESTSDVYFADPQATKEPSGLESI
jgi:isocitrate dehydrogenase